MWQGERYGNSERGHDAFQRFTAPRHRQQSRSPSPDEYNFLNAFNRRQNSPVDTRGRPAVTSTGGRHDHSSSTGARVPPSRTTYNQSISPPPLPSPSQRRRRLSSPRPPTRNSRDEPHSPHSTRAAFSRETRNRWDSSPPPVIRDHRERDLFESRSADLWDHRESLSAPRPHDERQSRGSPPSRRQATGEKDSRSSPPRQARAVERNESRSKHEDVSQQRTVNRPPKGMLYRNLRWTKPPSPQPRPTNAHALSKEAESTDESNTRADKTEVNGIKCVPTGPAQKGGNPPVPDSILKSPHIFISSKFVPALPTTTAHLARFVQRYEPDEVVGDDTGYFITFPPTMQGRSRLNQCQKAHKGQLLFGQYVLSMQSFAYGQKRDGNRVVSTSAVAGTSSTKGPQQAPMPQHDFHRQLDGEQRETEKGGMTRTSNPREEHSALAASDPVQPNSSALPRGLLQPRQTSPLRPTSPLGSTSSISGRTASDMSGMGSRKCHVCRVRSEADNLVKCTTCSRRYHRYCHTRKSIPAVPGNTWQCQRCERKNVASLPQPLVSEKAAESSAMADRITQQLGLDGSLDPTPEQTALFPPVQTRRPNLPEQPTFREAPPAPQSLVDSVEKVDPGPMVTSVARDEEQPRKRARLAAKDDAQFTESQDHVNKNTTAPTSSTRPDQLHERPGSTDIDDVQLPESQGLVEKGIAAPTPNTRPDQAQQQPAPANSDDLQFTEAQDLVEKSFAAPEPTPMSRSGQLQSVKKPGKLPMVKRTKPDPEKDIGSPDPVDPARGREIAPEKSNRNDLEPPSSKPERPKALLPGEDRENGGRKSTLKDGVAGARDALDSASPVDSVVPVTKRTKKPKVALASCVDCGSRTVKPVVGAARCIQCKKSNAQKAMDAAPRLSTRPSSQPPKGETPEATAPVLTCEISAQTSHTPVIESRSETRPEPFPDNVHMADEGENANDQVLDPFSEESRLSDLPDEDNMEPPDVNINHSLDADVQPSTTRQTKAIKRKSQRITATSVYDVGSSEKRPKLAYLRLAGMALCDAPGNRLQSKGIIEWICKNVTSYDKAAGIWVNGIKSTMRMNATGKVGPVIVDQVQWAQGDDGEEGKDWWVLRPGMKDQLDRWDYELQRPKPGNSGQWCLQLVPFEINAAEENGMEANESRLDSGKSPRSTKTKRAKSAVRKAPTKHSSPAPYNAMELDEVEGEVPWESQDVDSSEDESLASRLARERQSLVTSATSTPREKMTSFQRGQSEMPANDSALAGDRMPLAPFWQASNAIYHSPDSTPAVVRDDLEIRELVREEVENIDFSAKTLNNWPEYLPNHRFDREQKLAEIQARPTRKQLFGKPASVSSLPNPSFNIRPPPAAPALAVLQDAEKWNSFGKEVVEMEKPCETLADFLGVRDDVAYAPCVVKGQLAYREQRPNVRGANTTGIRLDGYW